MKTIKDIPLSICLSMIDKVWIFRSRFVANHGRFLTTKCSHFTRFGVCAEYSLTSDFLYINGQELINCTVFVRPYSLTVATKNVGCYDLC